MQNGIKGIKNRYMLKTSILHPDRDRIVAPVIRYYCYLFLVWFCFPYIPPVSCVPNVASVSGLFILDCPSGFL